MITRIVIKNVATFDATEHVMEDLGKLNFIFGPNGSGKTTISRVLKTPEKYSSCSLSWEGNMPIERRVYNSDFVEANFVPEEGMPGIFTLGQEESDTKKKIKDLTEQLTKLEEEGGVWFTLDIPVSDGPWKLCGLPGLILRATDEQGYFDFDCTGVASIEIPPIRLMKKNYTDCTPEKYFEMEKDDRENPLGHLKSLLGDAVNISEASIRKTDQRNNEEAKKKFTYIERYD